MYVASRGNIAAAKTFLRKIATGGARSREQSPGRWPMVSASSNCSFSKNNQRNHMATKVCFIDGATRGIGAQIAKAPLADGNRFAAIDRKSGSRTPRPSDNLHPGAPELARKDPVEMTASLLPIIAVAFTVGGPVVYERRGDQFAYHETND